MEDYKRGKYKKVKLNGPLKRPSVTSHQYSRKKKENSPFSTLYTFFHATCKTWAQTGPPNQKPPKTLRPSLFKVGETPRHHPLSIFFSFGFTETVRELSLSYKHANPEPCHSFHFYPSQFPLLLPCHSSSEFPRPWRSPRSRQCWNSWEKMGFRRPSRLSKRIWLKRAIWVLSITRNSCFRWCLRRLRWEFRRVFKDRWFRGQLNSRARDRSPRMTNLWAWGLLLLIGALQVVKVVDFDQT